MTYREWIQGYPDEDLGGFIELKMETYNKICERLAYLEENAEKYRWHDYPNELPFNGEEILIYTNDNDYRVVNYGYQNMNMIVAWRYIEPFERGQR